MATGWERHGDEHPEVPFHGRVLWQEGVAYATPEPFP